MKLKGYFKILRNKREELDKLIHDAHNGGWGRGVDIRKILSPNDYHRYVTLIAQIDGMRIGRRYTLSESVRECKK